MANIHVKSSFPERLAEILADINDKLNLGLSIEVVSGNSGKGLVHVSNDGPDGRTKTQYRNRR